jgi:hypothetical protein
MAHRIGPVKPAAALILPPADIGWIQPSRRWEMREGRWMIGSALTLALAAGTIDPASAAELCTKRSGAVVRREVACKKSETVK